MRLVFESRNQLNMESRPRSKVRFKRIDHGNYIEELGTQTDSRLKNTFMMIMQDCKNGHVTRAPEMTIHNTISQYNEGVSFISDICTKKNSAIACSNAEEKNIAKRKPLEKVTPLNHKVSSSEKETIPDESDPCKLVFKYYNGAHCSSAQFSKKKLRFVHVKVERKLNKGNEKVNLDYEGRISKKPTFKIKRPPTLEQQRLEQSQFMGLLETQHIKKW